MAELLAVPILIRISVPVVLGLVGEVRHLGNKMKKGNKDIDMLVLRSQSCIQPLERLSARGVNKQNEVALQYLKFVLEKMIKFLGKVESRGVVGKLMANDVAKIAWLNEHLSHASLGICVNKAIMDIPEASNGIHATSLFISGQSDSSDEDNPLSPGRAGSATDGMEHIPIDFNAFSELETAVVIGSGNGSNGSVVKKVMYSGKMVALKKYTKPTLSSKFSAKAGEVKNVEKLFVREALIMHALNHPNIITFIGADLPKFVMIMELALCSLYDVLHSEESRTMYGFSLVAPDDSASRAKVIQVLTTKLSILNDIAGAISYLHLLEFIHRDIKSMNVLLCGSGGTVVAKLADFGASKDVKGEETVPGLAGPENTISNGLNGTIAYLAPEQIDGDRPLATFAVDVFAFGVLCNEVMTNTIPWGTDNMLQIIAKVKYDLRCNKLKPPFYAASDATTDIIFSDINQLIGDHTAGMLANDPLVRFTSHRVSAFISEFLARSNAVGLVNDELSQLQSVVTQLTTENAVCLTENSLLKEQLQARNSMLSSGSDALTMEDATRKWKRKEDDWKRRLSSSLRSKKDSEKKAGHITDKLKEDVNKYKTLAGDAKALLRVESNKVVELSQKMEETASGQREREVGYKRRLAEAAEKINRLTDATLKAAADKNMMKSRLEGAIANLHTRNSRLEGDVVRLQDNLLRSHSSK